MSEINKINANQPFDVRINQASPDPKEKRETTVTSQDQSQTKQEAPSSKSSKQSQAKLRRSSAMDEMLDALRKQNLEEDAVDYKDRRQELYRERNRQASEEYLQRLKEGTKLETKKVVQEQVETKDNHKVYHSRIQDISRSHIQKMLKHRLEEGTYQDVKNTDPDEAKKAQKQDLPSLRKGLSEGQIKDDIRRALPKLDTSRFRPELSKMLDAQKLSSELRTEQAALEHEPQEAASNKNLLDAAINKIKNRLGGAHKAGPQNTGQEFKHVLTHPVLDEAALRQVPKELAAPIRADLNQVQESMRRSQALKSSADGSRYVPLEDSDVQKILIENKLPVDYATVQAIKYASQVMQNSSSYFQKSASLLAHIGLPIDVETMELVTNALNMYEKYGRQSILNKLLRYLTTKKYTLYYQQMRANDLTQTKGAQIDLGQALLNPEYPELGGQLSGSHLQTKLNQMRAVQSGNTIEGMNLPPDADEKALKSGLQALLKSMGLPASKVMVNQLLQSAQGSIDRAQTLVLLLAAGKPLNVETIDQVQQKLAGLSEEDRQLPSLELMKKLDLPVPLSVQRAVARSRSNPGFDGFLARLGLRSQQLDQQAQGRETLEVLQKLTERSMSESKLMPKLVEMFKHNPEQSLKNLSQRQESLRNTLSQLPDNLKVNPEQQDKFAQNLMLALESPPDRQRAWERVLKPLLLGSGTDEPTLSVLFQSKTPAAGVASGQPGLSAEIVNAEDLFAVYQWPKHLQDAYPMARELLLHMHLQAERSDILNRFIPAVNQSLRAMPEAFLAQLESSLPAINQLLQSKPEGNVMQILEQIKSRATQINPQEAPLQRGPFSLPESRVEQTLLRFYPDMSAGQREQIAFSLQGSGPQTLDSFSQLNRLLRVLEPDKASILSGIWQQPKVIQRLTELGQILRPVMESLETMSAAKFFVSSSFQNQLVKGLQSWFFYGKPDAIKDSLYLWMQPETAPAVSLGKVKEHLERFGVDTLPEEDLLEIWQMSGGSRDKMDAIGILLRGKHPLIPQNLQIVLQYIEKLPPAWRHQGVADILLYLSPELTDLINREIGDKNLLGHLNTVLKGNLPVQPETWNTTRQIKNANAMVQNFDIDHLIRLTQQMGQSVPSEHAQDFRALEHSLRDLGKGLLELRHTRNADFSSLLTILQNLNEAYPTGLSKSQPQIQAWMTVLASLSQTNPLMARQFEDGLSTLLMQVRDVFPSVLLRTEHAVLFTRPDPDLIAQGLKSQYTESVPDRSSSLQTLLQGSENLTRILSQMMPVLDGTQRQPWIQLQALNQEIWALLNQLNQPGLSTEKRDQNMTQLYGLLQEMMRLGPAGTEQGLPTQAWLKSLGTLFQDQPALLKNFQKVFVLLQQEGASLGAFLNNSSKVPAALQAPQSFMSQLSELPSRLNLSALLQQIQTMLPGLGTLTQPVFSELESLLSQIQSQFLLLSRAGQLAQSGIPLSGTQLSQNLSVLNLLLQNLMRFQQPGSASAEALKSALTDLQSQTGPKAAQQFAVFRQLLTEVMPRLSSLSPEFNLLSQAQTLQSQLAQKSMPSQAVALTGAPAENIQISQALNLTELIKALQDILPGLKGAAQTSLLQFESLLTQLKDLMQNLNSGPGASRFTGSEQRTLLMSLSQVLLQLVSFRPEGIPSNQGLEQALGTLLTQQNTDPTRLLQHLHTFLAQLKQFLPEMNTLTQAAQKTPQPSNIPIQTSIATLLQVVQTLVPDLNGSAKSALQNFENMLKQVFSLMQPENANSHAKSQGNETGFQTLSQQLQAILNFRPPGTEQALSLQNALTQLLGKSTLPQASLSLLSQTLGAFEGELRALLSQSETPVALNSEHLEQAVLKQAPSEIRAQPNTEETQDIQNYLQKWGLSIQDPALLLEIQSLMQGATDRLDAIAMLLKGNVPLLPVHIEVIAQYVKLLPPSERFKSISKILSFLSDDLIQLMKKELKEKQKSELKSFPGIPDPDDQEQEEMENMLRQPRGNLTKSTLQAARYQVSSGASQQYQSLDDLKQLMVNPHAPGEWFGALEQVLQQTLSLLTHEGTPASLDKVLEVVQKILAQLQPHLEPQSEELAAWMKSVLGHLGALSTQLKQAVGKTTGQKISSENWLEQLAASLLGLLDWLADHEPQKSEQCKKMQAFIRTQMNHLQQSLESLEQFHQHEMLPQQEHSQTLTQYLPAFLEHFGYPVEILTQHQEPEHNAKGEKQTEVQLKIQTHSLGHIYISLLFKPQGLGVRFGVENRAVQHKIQPFLDQLKQKLAAYPWEISAVQIYLLSEDLAHQPVIAQHYYRRLSNQAIKAL